MLPPAVYPGRMGGQKRFDDPVTVFIDGREQVVSGLAEAGRLLMESWPLDTDRRKLALQAVAAALRDTGSIEHARRSFVDAALEVWAFRSG
jgi:hypothetical protein